MKQRINFILLWLSTVTCFLIGITLPAFTMLVTIGGPFIDAIANALLPNTHFGLTKLTIIESIFKLLRGGDAGNISLGILIFLFSVFFPCVKYTLLLKAFLQMKESDITKTILKYGYWSMLDVFVVAILVVAMKGFPGGSRIIPEVGVYFFAASVILSNITHKILQKCLQRFEL